MPPAPENLSTLGSCRVPSRTSTPTEQQPPPSPPTAPRYKRDLLDMLSLLPRYQTSPSPPARPTSAASDIEGHDLSGLEQCADPGDEDTPPSPLSQPPRCDRRVPEPDAGLNPIHITISTRLEVARASDIPAAMVPSPSETASCIADRVLGSLAAADVPMVEGGRPRPIRIEIDAGISVREVGPKNPLKERIRSFGARREQAI